MFMRIFFIAWTLMHVYVFWRIATIPRFAHRRARIRIVLIAAVLWSSIFLSRALPTMGTGSEGRVLELVTMDWLGIIFLISVSFLVVDIVTMFGVLWPRRSPTLRGWALVAGIGLSAIALVQGFRAPVVDDFEVRIKNLPTADDGMVIAAISDLHVGPILDQQWLAARVNQLNELHPDMILLLGDILEGHGEQERQANTGQALSRLSAPLGVWMVTGNHESHGGQDAGINFFEASGIHVLQNRWSEIHPGLAIGGIDDGGHYGPVSETADRLTRTLSEVPEGDATIFLSHRPQRAEEVAKAGVGLMLSGHTHAGQIWPFTYVSALANPLFAGRYVVDGMPVIVSRGAGTWGPRMRLWRPGEIMRITLRAS